MYRDFQFTLIQINKALCNACCGGNMDIVNFCIAKGADDWDWGLYGACRYSHREIKKKMIDNGAKDCYWCHKCV
jgi:hypothetical protein